MDASLMMLAARLVQCVPGDVLVARWQGDRLVVVWGIGWKRIFERAEVEAIGPGGPESGDQRAQMIEIFPTNDTAGLHALFPRRVAQVLIRAGYGTPGAVQRASDAELWTVGGIGPRTLADIRELLPYLQQSSETIGG